jgi:hypothetical protein
MWEYDQLLHQCMTRPFLFALRNHNVGPNNNMPIAVQMQVLLVSFLNLPTEGDKIITKQLYRETLTHVCKQMVLYCNYINIILNQNIMSLAEK